MICALCGHPLKGMQDARRQGNRIVCADLDTCRMRQENRDRVAKGLEPRPYQTGLVVPIRRQP